MIKEIKYIFYLLVIFGFIIFIIKYYFSDNFKKDFYRSINDHQNIINNFSNNLFLYQNDTKDIIEYIDHGKSEEKFKFWKLIEND
tara:strand:- start:365 stop:619 length:255 start_codon:yes stop_codon:yes gene_type:complete